MSIGRRIRFDAPLQAVWEEIPIPDQLEPYAVVIQARASLISAGTELAFATGSHITFSLPDVAVRARFPLRTGYTLVGEIVAMGERAGEIINARPGNRVLASVNHSSIAIADARRTLIIPLPAGITDEQALLARMAAISIVGVRNGEVRLGDQAAVIGQGLIGQLAAQLSLIAGARPVIGIDFLASRLDVARANGITPLQINTSTDLVTGTQRMTDGRGLDAVIEATGNPQAIPTALELATSLGRIVLLGSPRGKIEIDPYTFIHKRGLRVIGAHATTTHQQETRETRWTERRNIEFCMRLFADGSLKTHGLISHRIPAAEALGIHAALHAHPEAHLGVVIDWAGA